MANFKLPSHHELTSLDPLDVCGHLNLEGEPTHWQLIEQLLSSADRQLALALDVDSWSHQFCTLLEDTAYSLHNDGSLDVGYLRIVLQRTPISDLQRFWSPIVNAALSLLDVFPTCVLPHLSQGLQTFSPKQIDSLLAHLFLGTFQVPIGNEWGRPGFLSWFKSSPPLERVVEGYTTTIIDHFIQGRYNQSITFTWSTCDLGDWASSIALSANISPHIQHEASEPSEAPDAFVLLSAHSQPGPGPAGTHEERLQGQSPALSICSLIAPRLPPDVAVVTSLIPVHARWRGHNRDARLVQLYHPDQRPLRQYIIADAMELDLDDNKDNESTFRITDREVRKLYAGFKQAALLGGIHRQPRIEAVPWGCQAFGGDLVVKARCMVIAAGLAGIDTVELSVTENRRAQIGEIMSSYGQRPRVISELVHASFSRTL